MSQDGQSEADAIGRLVDGLRLVLFDFDGVFTDNTVYVSQDGTEAVRCSRADGIGLRRLEQIGVATMILSTEVNPVVGMRARKLRIECMQGCEDKAAALGDICQAKGLNRSAVAFVGNDVNDLACMALVGLPIAVADAYPEVLAVARHRTLRRGGDGAVREVCDWIALRRERSALDAGVTTLAGQSNVGARAS